MPVNCSCSDTTGYRTLAQLRSDVMIATGYAVQAASPPPGKAAEINMYLQMAQNHLIQRFPALRTERWFTWSLEAGERFYDFPNNDENGLSPPTGVTASPSIAGGTLSAGTKSYRVSAINAIGETLAATAATCITIGASGSVTVSWEIVPGATGYNIYGRTGGTELFMAQVTALTWIDDGSITPAGALPVANTTIECTKQIDPYELTWVGVEQDSGWYELRKGINPQSLGYDQTGWPTAYEMRQCIEIWPAPSATTGSLRVKARFKQTAFSADGDYPSIDDRLVFLLAVANIKAAYGKPDAGNYVGQLEVLLGNLVAGSHGTKRYIPGSRTSGNAVYVEPRPLVPFT